MNSLPYMEKHWNMNIYHCWCCCVHQLAFICIWTRGENLGSNPPLQSISTTCVGGRCYLCVPLLPALLCTTLLFQVGDCTQDRVPGYICPLQGVLTTLAGLLDIVQELLGVHCIPPECFLKSQSRGRVWVVFIPLKVFHTVWLFRYR